MDNFMHITIERSAHYSFDLASLAASNKLLISKIFNRKFRAKYLHKQDKICYVTGDKLLVSSWFE
jgi:hypothetical protein